MPTTKHWTTEPDGEVNVKVLRTLEYLLRGRERERERARVKKKRKKKKL